MDSFGKLLVSIFIFAFVLFLTYFTTKYVSKLQKTRMTGRNITVIETQKLSAYKDLYIVKLGQEYYALASGKDTVNVIGKLDSSGLILPEENPESDGGHGGGSQTFEHVLEKFRIKKQDKE